MNSFDRIAPASTARNPSYSPLKESSADKIHSMRQALTVSPDHLFVATGDEEYSFLSIHRTLDGALQAVAKEADNLGYLDNLIAEASEIEDVEEAEDEDEERTRALLSVA